MVAKKKAKKPKHSSSRALIGAALLASMNLTLFGTLEVFQANRVEFDASLVDLLPVLLGVSLVLTALLAGAGSLVPRRHRPAFSSIVLMLGTAAVGSGSIPSLGLRGVSTVRPSIGPSIRGRDGFDAGIWISALAVAYRFRRPLSRNGWYVALAFVVINTGAYLTRTLVSSNDEFRPCPATPRILVPFPRVCATYPRHATCSISSWTVSKATCSWSWSWKRDSSNDSMVSSWFPENISTSWRTIHSVPATFSTSIYAGDQSESEYYRKAMAGSFHYMLYDSGYVVNLLPHIDMSRTAHTRHFVRPTTYALSPLERIAHAAAYLIDVGIVPAVSSFLETGSVTTIRTGV